MTLIILFVAIIALLLLISWLKVNPFLSLTLVTIVVGLAHGLSGQIVVKAMAKGVGDTMGSLLFVIGFGVMLGSLITETGAAQQICNGFLRLFGEKYVKLVVLINSLIVGIALFYNAGFIVLIPLVFAISSQLKTPLVPLVIAMATPLAVTHGFLPPHPGPTAVAQIMHASVGKTLLYGLCVAVPTLTIVGLGLPRFVRKIQGNPPEAFFEKKLFPEEKLPGFLISIFSAALPVLLIICATVFTTENGFTPSLVSVFSFLGDSGIAMIVSVVFALLALGIFRGVSLTFLMEKCAQGLQAVAAILLINAAGGAFKEVLTVTHTDKAIVDAMIVLPLSPLLMAWIITAMLRAAIGAATLAAITSAGIVSSLIAATGTSPELAVLAIGAGSLMFSHVNDSGFWLFKEYLGISVKDTFRSWTVMEMLTGSIGIIMVLLLSTFVR
ncbi:MAG: gluconate:H+ symporter [Dysgonamonadaceae bacterium]